MRGQGGGRIINFYSNDADIGQWMHSDYNATKGGIRALTVSGAAEWGRHNILCNAIAPAAAGTIYYKLLETVPNFEDMIKQHPLGRAGDPENDIGPVALFLATEDSQYMNGQTLYVDGGMSLGRAGIYPSDAF
jgi:3-oxoacyl-[acyl-carrier protein] reductase